MTPAEARACVDLMRIDWPDSPRPPGLERADERMPPSEAVELGTYWRTGETSPRQTRDSFAGVRSVTIAAVGQVIVVNLTVMEAEHPPTACLACVDVSGWDADAQLTSSVIWGRVWQALGSDDWRTRSATQLSSGLVVLTGLVDPGPVRGDRVAT